MSESEQQYAYLLRVLGDLEETIGRHDGAATVAVINRVRSDGFPTLAQKLTDMLVAAIVGAHVFDSALHL